MPAPAKHSTLDASGDSVVAVSRRTLRITVGRSHNVSRGTDPPVSPEYPQPNAHRHLVSSHTRSRAPPRRKPWHEHSCVNTACVARDRALTSVQIMRHWTQAYTRGDRNPTTLARLPLSGVRFCLSVGCGQRGGGHVGKT